MITNEVQYRAVRVHLERFDEAAANIEARPGKRTKLEQLEVDAVRSQADGLRVELSDTDIANALGVVVAQHAELTPSA